MQLPKNVIAAVKQADKRRYIISASRSKLSLFGQAQSEVKNPNGTVMEFTTRAAAEEYCDKLNENTFSRNISYMVKELF